MLKLPGPPRALLGLLGEWIASIYLRCRGYRIECRRYRIRYGEIDLIAWEKGTLCFIEVKTRLSSKIDPLLSIDYKKRRSLIRTANHYVARTNLEAAPRRFDVVEVTRKKNWRFSVELHKNAFQDDDRYR